MRRGKGPELQSWTTYRIPSDSPASVPSMNLDGRRQTKNMTLKPVKPKKQQRSARTDRQTDRQTARKGKALS
eukprot:SAG22_NODE_1219_length_5132_cov_2.957878_2_plen_72_part_00